MATYWLSFADPDLPRDQQFLGVALVEIPDVPGQSEADRIRAALQQAWLTGCNPGGEVQSSQIPVDELPPEKLRLLTGAPKHTLMSRAVLKQHGLLE